MNRSILIFFKDNALLMVYLVVIFFLGIGMAVYTGTEYLLKLGLYSLSFLLAFLIFKNVLKQSNISGRVNSIPAILNKVQDKFIVTGAAAVISCIILFHFISYGEIPLLRSFNSLDSLWIADYRNSLTANSSTFLNYLSSFTLTAVIPFFILFFHEKAPRWLFLVLVFICAFYAMNTMHKSVFVTIFLPLLAFKFLRKQFAGAFLIIIFIFASLFLHVYIANPDMRGKDTASQELLAKRSVPSSKPVQSHSPFVSISIGLADRIFITPGQIVSLWFTHVPKDKPFLNGCGYRFAAPLLNCEYRSYANELYPIFFPEYRERGYTGTVNGASFVYDYANFGSVGLVISGLLLGFILSLVELIYRNFFEFKIALNVFPIFMLSSSALTTLVFSGGWGLTVILFVFFGGKLVKRAM